MPDVGVQVAIGDAPQPQPVFGMPLLGPAALQYVRATKPRGVREALGERPRTRGTRQQDAASDEEASGKEPKLAVIERADQRLRLFHPQGAMLRADFDREHWLSAGVHARAPVFIDGDFAFIARPPVHVVGRMAETDSLQLSGLVWPEAAARIARTAYLTQETCGKGQIILFADDPTFRRSMRGIERLLLNAVVLGPGLGTSRPAPWCAASLEHDDAQDHPGTMICRFKAPPETSHRVRTAWSR